MSDIPRTDAFVDQHNEDSFIVEFCRQLEHELTESRLLLDKFVEYYPCGTNPALDKLLQEAIKMKNKAKTVTIKVICEKCKHEYSYEVPLGSRGRTKKCPKCDYQDMRK